MASWDFASQLFLVSLFSWSVHTSSQLDWRQSNSKNVNPELHNAKAEGFSPRTSNPAGTSVSWVAARPQSKLSFERPSNKVWPAVSVVASPQKLVPPPALNPDGPTDLSSAEAPTELPPSDPKGPVVSLPVESLTKLSPPLSPEDPFDFPESLPLPQNSEALAVLELVGPPEKLPLPPSNPEGPAVSWQVDSAKKLPFLSNPEMPAVPWKVGRPKKFPPPPPAAEGKGQFVIKTQTPPKTQVSAIPWLNKHSEKERSYQPTSEGAGVRWVVQPPKRELLLLQSPESAAAWRVNVEEQEVDPFRSAVVDLGEMPLEGFASYLPLITDPNLPPVAPEDLYPLKGGPAQATLESETDSLASEPLAYPEHPYQGGELSRYASIYEHGNSEHETEDYRVFPMYPYGAGGMPVGVMPPPYMNRVVPNLFYLFLTGQLPHGTVSHTQTNYEAGGDHTTNVGYEKDLFSAAQGPGISQKKVSTQQL